MGDLTFPFISSRRRLPLRGSLSSAFGAPLLQGATPLACKNADPSKGLLPHIVISSEARNLFRSRQGKGCGAAESGKHRAPCESEERCFMQTDSRMKQKMKNEKDPSATLGMTIRETAFLIFPFIPQREPTSAPSGHLLPGEGGRMPHQRLPKGKATIRECHPPKKQKKYRQVSLTVSDLYPHHVVKAGF